MGLKDLFRRWTTAPERATLERAEEETRMTPHERDVHREDFEVRKADILAESTFAGRAAKDAAEGDLQD